MPHKYARVIRFVDHLVGKTLATLDRDQNLLIIDRNKFERLDEYDKNHLIFTDSVEVILEENVGSDPNVWSKHHDTK